jgi:hypothetical protein
VTVDAFGVAAAGLPPEEELVFVAAHAGKPNHIFDRLIWFADVAVIISSAGRALDWDRVARFARSAECETVLGVALHHARRFGVTVPDEVIRLPSNRYRRLALAPLLDVRWPLDPYEPLSRRRLRFVLLDSLAARLSLVAEELTKAGPRAFPGAVGYFTRTLLHRLWLWRRAPREPVR